ncbi:hypothetical protein HW555_005080 [Spodoptera exigua]|uniref:MADF domain-containing protein n=2 Tax=Spodoptera exigua TaxID=7107 RepID=A0A835L5R0_SPOEX|nr:hypothetical protein HW555_013450 [Spodoptera exigua]KAF9417935.1 hypothetical protein HW555_005080 [Spodoptera exigua]
MSDKSFNWTNELEKSFLEQIQMEPVLWNKSLKDYKNKLKNHDAWKRISTIMEIPVDELKTKKTNLFSSYRNYKSKIKKSEKSGAGADDVYKPIWFGYNIIDSMIGDTTINKTTINTPENMDDTEQENPEEEQENQSQNDSQQSQDVNTNTTATPTVRRRKNPSELTEAGKMMKEALVTFKSTIKRHDNQSINTIQEDDCDLYGRLLAKKLRRLSEEKRLRLMHDIDGMILSSHYTASSASSSPIPPLSPIQPPLQQQYVIQYQPRPGTSSSTHSEPIIQCQPRPGTSSSTHSEPIIHYSPMTIQNSITNNRRNIGSSIIIQSNEVIHPPVVHIPDLDTIEDANIDMIGEEDNIDILQKAFMSS